MLKFILKKLAMMIPMLLVISLVVFVGLRSTGVDPMTFVVPPEVMSQQPELVEQLREELGYNDHIVVQYFRWLGNLVQGDLGLTNKGEDIGNIIATRLPYTLELSAYAMLLSAIIGIGIGIISAIRQNGIVDYIGRVLAVLGQAVPQFLVGIIMIWIFSIQLGIFPAANRVSPDATNAFVDAFMHLFLPVTTLTIGMVAVLMRYARNTMLDVLNSDYIKTARSKGLSQGQIMWRHALRNAVMPVVTIMGPTVASVLTGTFVIESIFNIPGLGKYFVTSIKDLDYTMIGGTTVFYGALLIACTLVVDLLYGFIDPRVKLED